MPHDDLWKALAASRFRSRQRLNQRDAAYLNRKGLATVLDEARGFLDQRLALAEPANDGRQTPMRGHPAFVAQHATATCCRGCLEKWHHIPRGQSLTADQLDYILSILKQWLERQTFDESSPPPAQQRTLFD